MKKVISLTLALILSMIPVASFAESSEGPSISATSLTIGYNCKGSIQYWGFPCEGGHFYEVTSSNSDIVDVYEIDAWIDGEYGYDENGRDIHTANFATCGYGRAIITVSDGKYTRTCEVIVPDTRVRLNYKSVKLKKGKKVKLQVLNATGKVKWKSSNKKVATVSKKGVVKGKKKGKATITAKLGGKTYKCKVRVK